MPEPKKPVAVRQVAEPEKEEKTPQGIDTVISPTSPSEKPSELPDSPGRPEHQPVPDQDDNEADEVGERSVEPENDNQWHELLPELGLGGMAKQLAEHCLLKQQADDKVILALDNSGVTLQTSRTEQALVEALSQHFDQDIRLEFEVSETIGETPEKRRIRLDKELQQAAERSIEQDPFVNELRENWGGVVLPGSVKPNLNVDTF